MHERVIKMHRVIFDPSQSLKLRRVKIAILKLHRVSFDPVSGLFSKFSLLITEKSQNGSDLN